MSNTSSIPTFEKDFWDDEVIMNPYPHYETLRELGPAVWLEKNKAWALTHYDSVRGALMMPEVFSSAKGCMMNEPMNDATNGIMLCSDDPEHAEMRRLFAKPLTKSALEHLKPRLLELAETRVAELAGKDSFDAVTELAHFLPLSVVTELVGLDEEGRSKMLYWAAGIFNAFGPIENQRTLSGLEIAQEAIGYVVEKVDRANLVPDGWGEALFVAADKGIITEQKARMMLVDYLSPALDTTINATSAAIELFAKYPDQWERLSNDPSLIPSAINEVVRMESPIRAFSRYVTQDHEIDGIKIPQGSRALMLYGCANRDPAKFPDPDKFDVGRQARDHLGFGMGIHVCAGMNLAKLEITVLLEALIAKVKCFEVLSIDREPHNTLRGLTRLETRIVPL